LYEGSSTKPECESMYWVVMTHTATMSSSQLSAFTSTLAHMSHTQAPAGTNNRPIQPLVHQHPELFLDVDCFVRYCHNVFSLGPTMDLRKAGGFLGLLIAFTLMFETISGYMERKVDHRRTAREMVAKVHKELSVLGLVSFLTFAFSSICNESYRPASHIEFEFVHILLFSVALLYVFFSGTLLWMITRLSKQWDKVFHMEAEEVLSFVQTKYTYLNPTSWSIFGHPGPTLDLGIFLCSQLFIERYHLPDNFDFSKYVKYYVSKNIKGQLDISPMEWMCVALVILMWFVWAYFAKLEFAYGPIGWFNVGVLFIVWLLVIKSFKNMLKLLGVTSLEDLKEKVKIHGLQPRHHKSKALIMAQHAFSVANLVAPKPPPKKEKEKKRMTFTGAFLSNTMDRLTKQQKRIEELQACWVPYGHSQPILITTSITMLSISFYFGFYLLNARSYLAHFQQFLVITSVAFIMFVLLPLVVLTITAIEAMSDPDYNLIGEVMEYSDQLHRVRENLVNTLFPEFDSRLLEDVTEKEIKDVFEHFDKNGDYSIDMAEFVKGCQMLGMSLSEAKARRFVRMFDDDLNGEIDGRELFTTIFNERISRIDTKLVAVFNTRAAKGHYSEFNCIKLDEVESVLRKVFGDASINILQKRVFPNLVKRLRPLALTYQERLAKQEVGKTAAQLANHNPNMDPNVKLMTLMDLRHELVDFLVCERVDYIKVVEKFKQEDAENKARQGASSGSTWQKTLGHIAAHRGSIVPGRMRSKSSAAGASNDERASLALSASPELLPKQSTVTDFDENENFPNKPMRSNSALAMWGTPGANNPGANNPDAGEMIKDEKPAGGHTVIDVNNVEKPKSRKHKSKNRQKNADGSPSPLPV